MKETTILTALFVVLVLIAAFQIVQLAAINGALATGAAAAAPVPSAASSLPSMVGGC